MIEFRQLLCYLISQSPQPHCGVRTRAITGGGVPRRNRHNGTGIEVENATIMEGLGLNMKTAGKETA